MENHYNRLHNLWHSNWDDAQYNSHPLSFVKYNYEFKDCKPCNGTGTIWFDCSKGLFEICNECEGDGIIETTTK